MTKSWYASEASCTAVMAPSLRSLQVLFPEAVATQLAVVHAHVSAARAPRHQLAALQALRAMVAVLGERACLPLTLRYAVHIVLQHAAST